MKLKYLLALREAHVLETDDPAEAASRLEAALERIAALAQRLPAQTEGPDAESEYIAARLDSLIAHLRAALSLPAG